MVTQTKHYPIILIGELARADEKLDVYRTVRDEQALTNGTMLWRMKIVEMMAEILKITLVGDVYRRVVQRRLV